MMRYSTPQQVAHAVLEIIPNYRRWLKGAEVARSGARHCVIGAVRTLGLEEQVEIDFYDSFLKVANEQNPHMFCYDGKSENQKIVHVNDHVRTRYADIRLFLEKIAAG
jgi:hypothetical protein